MTAIELDREAQVSVAPRSTSIAVPVIAVSLLGSGLVVTAIGAGMDTWAAFMLAATGLTQLVAAIMVFTGQATKWSRTIPVVALIPFGLWAALVPLDAISVLEVPLFPMLAAFLLALPAVIYPRIANTAALRQGLAMIGLLCATAVVAVIATAALAGTPAGGLAVPHGEHGVVSDHDH